MVSKICERCKKKIKEKIEDYFKVETYEKGQKVKTGYLHKKCGVDMNQDRKQTQDIMKVVVPLANRVNQILDKIGIENKQFFEVK